VESKSSGFSNKQVRMFAYQGNGAQRNDFSQLERPHPEDAISGDGHIEKVGPEEWKSDKIQDKYALIEETELRTASWSKTQVGSEFFTTENASTHRRPSR
jgi:hypothetical protein